MRWSLLAWLLAVRGVGASMAALGQVSFTPPFVELDDDSMKRIVSTGFDMFGDAEVFQSFARLTKEASFSKGALWSKETVGSDSLSLVFKFRLSGRGDVEHRGEGIAVWIAATPLTYREGKVYGLFADEIVGLGLLFDTRAGVVKLFSRTPKGDVDHAECDTNVRYDARRDDFDFRNTSSARLIIRGSEAQILLDDGTRDKNMWRQCAKINLPPILANPTEKGGAWNQWLRESRIGITSATGTSADSHDVISLEAFGDVREHDAHLNNGWKKFLSKHGDAVDDRLGRVEEMLNWVNFKLSHMSHVFEHASTDFAQGTGRVGDNLVSLGQSESQRLASLEVSLTGSLTGTFEAENIPQRIDALQAQFDDAFTSRLSSAGGRFREKIKSRVNGELSGLERSWQRPFYLLLAVHLLVFGSLAFVYRKLKASLK